MLIVLTLVLGSILSSHVKAYALGISYWMLDEEESTVSYTDTISKLYQDAKGWVRPEESYDAFALRKMNQFLKAGSWNPLECLVASAGMVMLRTTSYA